MMLIDSQVHAYEADTPGRPWHSVPDWPAHVTADEMIAAMDSVGVAGAIQVSPFSLYQYDASYSVEVRQRYPERFALVAPIDPGDPAAAEAIEEWRKVPGAVGVRLLYAHGVGSGASAAGIDRLLLAAQRAGLPVNLFCWNALEAATALIDRYPEVRFVLDHLGLAQPRTLPQQDVWAELPGVLELARRPHVAIKVSGACTLSAKCFPYPDIWPPLHQVFDAWGIERCLWGTDWTRAAALCSYQDATASFIESSGLGASDLAWLMGGTCARVYGWAPSTGTQRSAA